MTYTYNPFEGKFDATQWTYASGILTTKIPSNISIPKDGVATGVNFGVSSYYIDLNAEGWDGAAGYDTSTRIINYQPVGGTVKGSLGLLFNNQLHFIITETDLAAVAPTGNVFGYGASVAPTGNGTKIIFRGGGSAGGNGAGGNLVFIGGAPNGVGTRGEVVIGEGTAGIDYSIVFDGDTNDGIITWMEDEDYFLFADNINLGGENLYGDSASAGGLIINSTSHATKGLISMGNASTGFIYDEVNNRVSLGTTLNTMSFNGVTVPMAYTSHVTSNSPQCNFEAHLFGDTATVASTFFGARSRGTEGAESIVQDGDVLTYFTGYGYDGTSTGPLTDYIEGANITFLVDGTPGAGDMPGKISFRTTLNGTASATEKMSIDNAGLIGMHNNVTIGNGSAGVDYTLTFDGETNDGIITWMEDEDYFKFGDDVNVDTLTASKPVWTDASKTLISKDNTPCDLVVTRKTANSMTVTTGTLTSGNVASTQTWQDGSEVHITEVTGVPGFDVKFVFTSIANFCRVGISAYYAGSATHVCQIQIYDHTNTTWRNLWHLPGTALGHNYRYSDMPVSQATILADYISGSDEVWIRFYHPTSGNASHDLYIDYVSIIGE